MADRPRVFLSHSSKDKAFVRRLDRALMAYGVETFLDERDIRIGEDIPDKVFAEIQAATHLCYIISRHSVGSQWVKDELSKAAMLEKQRSGIFILPILIDKSDVPTSIANRRYADFTKEQRKPIHSRPAFKLLLTSLGVDPADYAVAKLPQSDAILYLGQLSSTLTIELLTVKERAAQLHYGERDPRRWGGESVVYYRLVHQGRRLPRRLKSCVGQLESLRPYFLGSELSKSFDIIRERSALLSEALKKLEENEENIDHAAIEDAMIHASVLVLALQLLLRSVFYFGTREVKV